MIAIKEASSHEWDKVHSIIQQAFQEYAGKLTPPSGAFSETVESLQNKVRGRGGAILVRDDEAVIGASIYYFEDDRIYIGRVSVLPEARDRGIGREMIEYMERLGSEAGVQYAKVGVRLSLPGNIAFYAKLGYQAVEEHDYPEGGDGWYVMLKKL